MSKVILISLFIFFTLVVKSQNINVVEYYSKKKWIKVDENRYFYKRVLTFINDTVWEVNDYKKDTILVLHGYVSSPTTKRKIGIFSYYKDGCLSSKSYYKKSHLQKIVYYKNNKIDTVLTYYENINRSLNTVSKSKNCVKIIYGKKEFVSFFKDNIKIPPLALHYWEHGQVCVRCIVNKKGNIIYIETVGSAFSDLLSEAKRLVVEHIKKDVKVTAETEFIIPFFFKI